VAETPGITSPEHLIPAEDAVASLVRLYRAERARLDQLDRLDAFAARAIARQAVR